jgi:phosphoserine phosphatase
MLDFCGDVLELSLAGDDMATLRRVIDAHFSPSDAIIARAPFAIPHLFVSDMDSTMIGQECIDELADFAGIKHQIAAITERAMQGELDFETALRERVMLLRDLSAEAITQCLATRIAPMPGARTLVETLKSRGCRTVLVTGGFHHFADPVAEMLGFERVVGNRLEVAGGTLTGGLVGAITDSSVKRTVLLEEAGPVRRRGRDPCHRRRRQRHPDDRRGDLWPCLPRQAQGPRGGQWLGGPGRPDQRAQAAGRAGKGLGGLGLACRRAS